MTAADLAVRWISVAATGVALLVAVTVPRIGLWSLLQRVLGTRPLDFADCARAAAATEVWLPAAQVG